MTILHAGLKKHWKLVVGSFLILLALIVLLRNFFFVNVKDAFVNATLVSVLSPIPGEVTEPLPLPGTRTLGAFTAKVRNNRPDEALNIETSERLGQITAELESALTRRTRLEAAVEEFSGWSRRHASARGTYLDQRKTEAEAEVAMAREQLNQAQYNLDRLQAQSQYVSRNTIDEAQTRVSVAQQSLNAALAREAQVNTERAALGQRLQIADSYSERTFSEQRLQETSLQLAILDGEIAALQHQQKALTDNLTRTTDQLGRESEAEITVPDAVVWRRVPATSHVVRGGEIGQVAPCTDALITVTLDRAAFRKLHVGMTASAVLRLNDGERRQLDATVVTLTGGSTQNILGTAIPFGRATVEDAYGAVLRVEDPLMLECAIGRPVSLRFGRN